MIATSDQGAAEPLKAGEKFPPLSVGPWSMDDLRRYAAASGDNNPIHLDPALAQRAGLPGPPVHGMLLMARFVPALAVWRPDLKLVRLSSKFLRPIFVDEGGELSGRVAQILAGQPTQFMLRLMMHNKRRELSLLAEALTILKPGG